MTEVAGLALGVLALFSTCVEAFNIVVSTKECSQDYEELSALLGLQRLRFEIWGESVGLPSGRFNSQPKIPYNSSLDLPQVRPDIQRALENIRQLLGSVTTIDGRYGATSILALEADTSQERTSPGVWSLLALLIAICGLLASPNVNDPLIPEIAQKYVEDPDSYFEVPKMWTKKYADASKKPDESTLQFPEDLLESVAALPCSKMIIESADSEVRYSPSVQQYMRSKYDEKFSEEWWLHSTKSRSLSVSTTVTGTFSVSSEAKDSDSRSTGVDFDEHWLSKILDSFLLRDAVQGHLRLWTGECLSNIERLRMTGELRIALVKELHRTSFSSKGLSQSGFLKDSCIRTLVRDSAKKLFGSGQTVAESQYFGMLMETFGYTKRNGIFVEEGSGSTDPVSVTLQSKTNIISATEISPATTTSSQIDVPLMHSTAPYYSHQAQYKYGGEDIESSPLPTEPRQRRQSTSTPMKPPPAPEATETDARRHRIPLGYSLKNWDPREEPIMLLGSVFDANSLGKWIHDWTVYRHGDDSPIANMASEMWLLLIQLAEKVKRAEAALPRIREEENREMVEDFIESGQRLTDKLKRLLRACEKPMLKSEEKNAEKTPQLGMNAGIEFIDTLFGRERKLDSTEKVMSGLRLYHLRFDANVKKILGRLEIFDVGGDQPPQSPRKAGQERKIILTPVSIRTAFGLETIQEERSRRTYAKDLARARKSRHVLWGENVAWRSFPRKTLRKEQSTIENVPLKADQDQVGPEVIQAGNNWGARGA
ncbi:hypothetical protein V502_04416 [Pseudogymnoascus sp. VKM F-4520 (FW-2644)]|nr:hypothetical protein V502_04416 [Pseudogymnoascus sp. VKM F-4520 (FW-2644)]